MISLSSPVKTRAHSWPAGLKIATLCVLSIALFKLQELWVHVAVFICILGLYRLPGSVFFIAGLRSLQKLWPFVVMLVLYHLVTATPAQGAVIILRMLSAVAFANLVTMTTKLSQMMELLHGLSAPLRRFGVKTIYVETSVALVIRFTPILLAKARNLMDSWHARSDRRPGWRIVLPLTVLALDDADHIAEALRARGGFDAIED